MVPYLCYARKDQRTKARDSVTTRYVAALFEAVGVDRILSLDVHNSDVVGDPAVARVAVCSSVPPFRLDPELVQQKVEVLDVAPLFAEAIRRMHRGGSLAELLDV